VRLAHPLERVADVVERPRQPVIAALAPRAAGLVSMVLVAVAGLVALVFPLVADATHGGRPVLAAARPAVRPLLALDDALIDPLRARGHRYLGSAGGGGNDSARRIASA